MGFPLADYGFIVEGNGDRPFNGPSHFYNHLNYLFRTDAAQKWTNDLTSSCLFIKPDLLDKGEYAVSAFGEKESRQQLHSELLAGFKNYFGTSNLSQGGIVSSVFSFVLYAVDDGGAVVTVPAAEFPVQALAKSFEASGNARLMSLVFHVDQDDLAHLHGLYVWEGRKPRGKSRFDSVMRP